MWDGFVGNLIRRTNQRMLITALVVLACLAAFFAYNRRYFYGFFTGPRTVTAQQLTSATSPAVFTDPFLQVTDEGAEPTDLEEVTHEDGRDRVTAGFVSVVVDGHHMLVRVAPDAVPADGGTAIPAAMLTGRIEAIGALRGHIYGSYATPKGDLLPVYLDTYNYRGFGYGSLAIGLPILALAFWLLWRWWQASSDFSRHPLSRKLAAQGQLEMLIQQIDSEMAAPHMTFSRRTGRADLSQHWLIISQFMGVVAMQVPSIVWVHRSLIKRRVYFFITVSKRHLVNVYDQFGQKAAIQLSETQAGELFTHLRTVTPPAIHGFDKRLLSLWRKTPNKTGFAEAASAMLSGQVLPDQRITNRYNA